MRAAAVKNSNDFCRFPDFGMENALARIVRRRWPTSTLDRIAAEWGLTTGEARGVLYAQASRMTLNKIIAHKRNGGWPLLLEIGALMLGQTVDQFAQREIERLEHEHTQSVASNRRLLQVVRNRSAGGGVDV